MARGKEEDCSRRVGRAEMLLAEINSLPEDYQPSELEEARFKELQAKIGAALKQWRETAKKTAKGD